MDTITMNAHGKITDTATIRTLQTEYRDAIRMAQDATDTRKAYAAAIKLHKKDIATHENAADKAKTDAGRNAAIERLVKSMVARNDAIAAYNAVTATESRTWTNARTMAAYLNRECDIDACILAAVDAHTDATRTANRCRDKQSKAYHTARAALQDAKDTLGETIQRAARKAANSAMRTSHVGTVKQGKDGITDGTTTGGNDMMRTLRNGLYYGLTAHDTAYDDNDTNRTATDADDAIQTAAAAIWDMIADGLTDCDDDGNAPRYIRAAMAAIHRYIRAQDGATTVRVRKLYDDAGQLIAATEYRYERYRHIAIDDPETGALVTGAAADALIQMQLALENAETLQAYYDALKARSRSADAFQRDRRIIEWTAAGVTQVEIAARLDVSKMAICKRLQVLRTMALDLLDDGII